MSSTQAEQLAPPYDKRGAPNPAQNSPEPSQGTFSLVPVQCPFLTNKHGLPARGERVAPWDEDCHPPIRRKRPGDDHWWSVQLQRMGAGNLLQLCHQIGIAFPVDPNIKATGTFNKVMSKCHSIEKCSHGASSLHSCHKRRKECPKDRPIDSTR